ncbi:MAG: OmpA family protein [Rhodobacteraceae bacterium]|nr:OmpA family protein [Paracoccaceae bacterium]
MALAKPLGIAAIGIFALAGCDDPSNPEYQKTRTGAVIGGAVGALSQIVAGNSDGSVLKGAVIGAGAGAVIGNILDRQEADLRNDLGGSGATITNTGSELIVTLPEAITFDTDSTYVRSSLKDDLARLAANLQEYPDSTIDVIGHTDSVGDSNYNQNLSSRRAASVSNILLNNGVADRRIRAYGRGETSPVASNDTGSGRAQNRRVEIVIRPTA